MPNHSNTEAALIAFGTASTMGIAMSGFLHRSETHRAVKFHESIRQVGKFATWMLSGMNAKEWEVVHLIHHAYTDSEPTAEEWLRLQENYPGAPIEAFRDPHSPILEGHINVLVKNAPMYRRTAKAVMPYLRNLERTGVPREQWPEHLRDVDLSEDVMDRHVYNRPMAGVLGLVAMGRVVALATRDLETTAKVMVVHIPLVLVVGGAVNMLGHTGVTNTKREKIKVFLGMQPAVPDADNSYASNFFRGIEGITAGEAMHGDHHKNPGNAFISSRVNPLRDPTGVIINLMTKVRLGNEPLATIPTGRPPMAVSQLQ